MEENEIQALMANIAGSLNYIPCFWDFPNQIQFRIGLSDGPRIKFYKETDDLYYLAFEDQHSRNFHIGIRIESENFRYANEIYITIRRLSSRPEYQQLINNPDTLGIMLGNLDRIVRPVLDRYSA